MEKKVPKRRCGRSYSADSSRRAPGGLLGCLPELAPSLNSHSQPGRAFAELTLVPANPATTSSQIKSELLSLVFSFLIAPVEVFCHWPSKDGFSDQFDVPKPCSFCSVPRRPRAQTNLSGVIIFACARHARRLGRMLQAKERLTNL